VNSGIIIKKKNRFNRNIFFIFLPFTQFKVGRLKMQLSKIENGPILNENMSAMMECKKTKQCVHTSNLYLPGEQKKESVMTNYGGKAP
jgi:hypothetical protein